MDSIASIVKNIVESVQKNLVEVDATVTKILGDTKIPTEKEFFNFRPVNLPDDKYALAKRMDFRDDLSPLQMTVWVKIIKYHEMRYFANM